MADPIKQLTNYQHAGSSRGRHFKRAGAKIQGTLSNWVSQIVNARIAEREKLSISNRAWDLYLNDAMGHGIIEGLIAQTVNIGLTPQPDPMISWLKFDRAWQEDFSSRAYDLFEIWGLDTRNWCDAQQRCNFYMLQGLAYFQWKLEGIGLFQIRYKEAPFKPINLSILPIDPGRLITPTDATVKKEIFDGVEIGKDGEIKALYIRKDGKTGYFYSAKLDDCDRVEVTNAKTGLPNILTVCDVRNVSEYRNDSILGSMIKELKDSNDLADAAVVKALVSNIWTAFVESEGEATRLMNRQGTNSDLSADDWENRIQELDKGTLLFGQPGEKATFLDSKAPGDNYAMMWDSIVGRLGMATGRGAENVKRTYTASYSASRANIEDAEKFDDYDRMILTNRFCQPAFSMLLFEAATRDLLPVKNIGHFQENLYAYTRTNWLRPPIRPIDHAKEANADTTRLGNHTKSYSDIYGERSKDWKPALRQKAIELKYIQDLEAEFGVSMILHPETMSNIIDNNGGDN